MSNRRKHSTSRSFITIRMGAAHHDVTFNYAEGPETFNIRAMSSQQRGRFFGEFMAAVRRQHVTTGRVA